MQSKGASTQALGTDRIAAFSSEACERSELAIEVAEKLKRHVFQNLKMTEPGLQNLVKSQCTIGYWLVVFQG